MRHPAVAFAIGATCAALVAYVGNADYFALGAWITAIWVIVRDRHA